MSLCLEHLVGKLWVYWHCLSRAVQLCFVVLPTFANRMSCIRFYGALPVELQLIPVQQLVLPRFSKQQGTPDWTTCVHHVILSKSRPIEN